MVFGGFLGGLLRGLGGGRRVGNLDAVEDCRVFCGVDELVLLFLDVWFEL